MRIQIYTSEDKVTAEVFDAPLTVVSADGKTVLQALENLKKKLQDIEEAVDKEIARQDNYGEY